MVNIGASLLLAHTGDQSNMSIKSLVFAVGMVGLVAMPAFAGSTNLSSSANDYYDGSASSSGNGSANAGYAGYSGSIATSLGTQATTQGIGLYQTVGHGSANGVSQENAAATTHTVTSPIVSFTPWH
jgi:hypothetical protein